MGQIKRSMMTELAGRPESGGDWASQRAERDRKRRDVIARHRMAAQPIIKDLASIGFVVDSVWDFVNTPDRYDAALPVLIRHFRENYPAFVREGLVRSFGRPWARHRAWDHVLAAYLAEPNRSAVSPFEGIGAPTDLKEGMAVALSEMAHRSDLKALIELISNPENGPSRVFFVKFLARSKTPEAFDTLARLMTDLDLSREIAFRMKSKLKRWVRTSQLSHACVPDETFLRVANE